MHGHRRKLACITLVAGILLLTAGVVVIRRFDPATSRLYPPCLFHALTGLHCPGCGSTRAIYQLAHGRISAAFGLNPLAVLAMPFLAYWLISRAHLYATGRPRATPRVPPRLAWGLAIAVIAFWILRNVPARPLNWLAP